VLSHGPFFPVLAMIWRQLVAIVATGMVHCSKGHFPPASPVPSSLPVQLLGLALAGV
jgi:hypothetical protein